MKHCFILSLILSMLVGAVSCRNEDEPKPVNPAKQEAVEHAPKSSASVLSFTADEQAFIKSLKKKGVLNIATELNHSVYQVKGGRKEGFHYKMAKSFADHFGVKLNIKVVKWADLFKKDGEVPKDVMTDPQCVYTPDLLKQVDIYVHSINILPWREKLMSFAKVYPVRLLLITRKGEEINHIRQMVGKTIVTVKASSYYTRLTELEREHGVKFKYHFVDVWDVLFKTVQENNGFVTVRGSENSILRLRNYPALSPSIPVSDINWAGWGVRKDNKILTSVLQKYIDYTVKNGLMDRLWMDDFYLTLEEYYNIIGYKASDEN